MRRLLLLASLLVAALAGPATADAAATPCYGAPTDYIAAFDTTRGQPQDGAVTYAEPRWYNEQQSWATPRNETPGHHSQHIHMGVCIPNGATWTTTNRPFDVSYTFHNTTAYTVQSAGQTFLWGNPNSGPTKLGYKATANQIAALQAASDASGNNNVAYAYQSYQSAAPSVNGFKEVRSSLSLAARSSDAVFVTWILDTRWYETDNVAGLPTAAGIAAQIAVRNRSHVTFPKAGDPTTIQDKYHHSGWCGVSPGTPFGATQTAGSALFTTSVVSTSWTSDRTVCLYVTDGGGPATLMVDPDFHHHYDAPTAACPNVDSAGNCLGVWFWMGTIFSPPGVPRNIPVVVPIGSLAPGPHRLVFKSDDFADCFRQGTPCPPDVRGSWTNVSVLPFTVG